MKSYRCGEDMGMILVTSKIFIRLYTGENKTLSITTSGPRELMGALALRNEEFIIHELRKNNFLFGSYIGRLSVTTRTIDESYIMSDTEVTIGRATDDELAK